MLIAVTIISCAVILIGFLALIFIPEDDSMADISDAEMVWIVRGNTVLEVYESDLEPFLNAGFHIYGDEAIVEPIIGVEHLLVDNENEQEAEND